MVLGSLLSTARRVAGLEDNNRAVRIQETTENTNALISVTIGRYEAQIRSITLEIEKNGVDVPKRDFVKPIFKANSDTSSTTLKQLKIQSCLELVKVENAMKSYLTELEQLKAKCLQRQKLKVAGSKARLQLERERKVRNMQYVKEEKAAANVMQTQLEIVKNRNLHRISNLLACSLLSL